MPTAILPNGHSNGLTNGHTVSVSNCKINGHTNGKISLASKAAGGISHNNGHFLLSGPGLDYRFHVDPSGDLVHDYYGAPLGSYDPPADKGGRGWGTPIAERKREFPDSGRGDFRLPAIHIRHGNGSTVTHFKYTGYEITAGKPSLEGLPATFGSEEEEVSTLVVRLSDEITSVDAELYYSIFPAHSAIVRSFKVVNRSSGTIELQRAASLSVDFPGEDWDFLRLCGDWSRENQRERTRVHKGVQGFQNATGHSSHYYNPFFALVSPKTDEVSGDAYGFSLVYSGSFSVDVERFAYGRIRAMIGLNPLHLSYPVAVGESFQSPECVSVFSSYGIGGMSRSYHRLFRDNLCRSKFVYQPRPTLLNSWEAVFCDFDSARLLELATSAADLGVKLLVLDDGWFGNKYPRVNTQAGLGDWVPNEKRFPQGWSNFVDEVTALQTSSSGPLQFGLWVEPEMVNPKSELYEAHPDWVLASGDHERSEKRDQLVLDLGRREVQDYILDCMSNLLGSADITYIKWDCNRGIGEMPAPYHSHRYVLGLYRVLGELNARFPNVLFEGCASGGGRFDPGILHYWAQSWTSDNTDAVDRLGIQFGTTLVYPASSMGCHVSACPNEQVGRVTPLEFRAHVAMMGGSFGFELAMEHMSEEERAVVPDLIKFSEQINPIIIHGDMYRLALPEESNTPAAFYLERSGDVGVLFAFRLHTVLRTDVGNLKLQGLEAGAQYRANGKVYTGAALMLAGLKIDWQLKDYQSKVFLVERVY